MSVNPNDNDRQNGNEKSSKKPAKYKIPPELQRNETAAKGKSMAQRLSVNSNNGDEDDPCSKKEKKARTAPQDDKVRKFRGTPGPDPRFQQQNQTLRCYVMYTDFYRCEKILGNGHEACTWFHDVFTAICPNEWIQRWDQWREEGRFPWRGTKTPGEYPDNRYGDL